MSNRLREKDLQRLALKLHDAMTESKPRPSSGVSDAVGKSPIDTKRYEKGVKAAIRAFHFAYTDTNPDTTPRDRAGQDEKVDEGANAVSAGYDHDDEAEGDQRKGDRMAAAGDPEYDSEWASYDGDPEDDLDPKDKPENWVDEMPRVSRAGRDKSRAEDDAVRHAKPNTRRFAQARDDQNGYTEFFDGKPKKSKIMRASYKCSQCGEAQVVRRYAVSESSNPVALRLTTAKCSECGGKNVVRAPEGHAYVTEAQAVFSSRYRRESM